MPIYQYACTECGHDLEVRQSFTDDALTVCPACTGRLRKVLSPVGVVFKGSGFYRTDSRNGASGRNGADGSDGKAASDGSDPAKTDAAKTAADKTGASEKGVAEKRADSAKPGSAQKSGTSRSDSVAVP